MTKMAKPTIILGAYGWRHTHWLDTFYPEDLPLAEEQDWRLSYYSNVFDAVLLPADYWQVALINDAEQWLDDVPDTFVFFVECDAKLFARVSHTDLTAALKILSPQLSALVVNQALVPAHMQRLAQLQDALGVDVLSNHLAAEGSLKHREIWRSPCATKASSFALFQDTLTDLKSVRKQTEQFVEQLNQQQASIIVEHARLQTTDLSRFRSLLEIMGF